MLNLCSYLFNLIGQFIGCLALQEQCCRIISALLKIFKSNPSKEIISVLGEQLQVCVMC
jgi:ataxia telangiectasia mutated family protein